MRYKNVTEGILKFRANDSKGVKKVFELKVGQEMDSDREVRFGGLEKVNDKEGKGKSNKKTKGDY